MLLEEKGSGVSLCREILETARINYEHLMRADAPKEIERQPKTVSPAAGQTAPRFLPPSPVEPSARPAFSSSALFKVDPAAVLDAAAGLPGRRKKGEGRAAQELAEKLNVSAATIYQAQKVLRYGSKELIEEVRNGKIGIKKASKTLRQNDEEQAQAEAG